MKYKRNLFKLTFLSEIIITEKETNNGTIKNKQDIKRVLEENPTIARIEHYQYSESFCQQELIAKYYQDKSIKTLYLKINGN